MRSVHRLGLTATLVSVGAGATLIAAAGPAAADTRISSPGDGAVITGSGLTVRANADGFAGRLLVNGTKVDEATGALTHGIDTHASRNGSYTAVLEQRGLTGLIWYRRDDVAFTVRAAPYTPGGTRATVSGRKVTVHWKRGPEPDLTGYDVTSRGATKKESAGSFCSGSACSTTISVPSKVAGKVAFGVRARRSNGSGGSISSETAQVFVAFPVGGGAGTVSPGGAGGAPGAGLPSGAGNGLDPLTGRSPLALPPVTPNGAVNGFQYPTPEPEVAAPSGARMTDASTVGSSLPTSLAIALVTLLAAAHLGMWTRRLRFAPVRAAPAKRHPPSRGNRSGPAGKAGATGKAPGRVARFRARVRPGARAGASAPAGTRTSARSAARATSRGEAGEPSRRRRN